jgi:hypothetical protein
MVGDERPKRRQPRRSRRPFVLRVAEGSDDLIDLPGGVPGELLDRVKRRPGTLGVPVVAHPRGARSDGDHVDGVSGGVVEVAGDPGPLLGHRQAALPFRLTIGAESALLQLGDLLAAQTGSLAGEPRDRPGEPGEQELGPGKGAAAKAGRPEVRGEERDDHGGAAPGPGIGLVAARREQVQRGGGPEEHPDRVAEAPQHHPRRGGRREDRAGGAPPGDERHGRARGQHAADPVELPRPPLRGADGVMREQGQGHGQRHHRDRGIGQRPRSRAGREEPVRGGC